MKESDYYPPSQTGEPTWEALSFLPKQGHWHEEDFLRLHTNRMAELVDGHLEILPVPTWMHQLLVVFIFESLKKHVSDNELKGTVMVAPIPVRLFKGTIREPDVLFVTEANVPKPPEMYPSKVDLAVEVVSEGPEARRRDHEEKRIDYAKAGITEFWIIDPFIRRVIVMSLEDGQYKPLEYSDGEIARSSYMDGFSITTSDVFAIVDSNR